jgi:hypothetical protein
MKSKEFLQIFLNRTFGVAMIVMMFGFVGFVAVLINKVLSGHGLDYYISGMGYEFNYLGVLILVVLIPFIMMAVWFITWYQEKDERDFKQKYLKKDDETHYKAN